MMEKKEEITSTEFLEGANATYTKDPPASQQGENITGLQRRLSWEKTTPMRQHYMILMLAQ